MNKKCPKCKSTQTKEDEGEDDFLSYKGEGEKAKRAKIKTTQKYFCWDCGYKWEEKID